MRCDDSDRARQLARRARTLMDEVVQDAIDLAVQCCGANGIGQDLPLSEFYESVRQFRIVDGADEVHRRVIARHAFEDLEEAELEPLTRFGDPVGKRE
ncbi:acyl-CoA dehydrogenase family protein [Natronococcus sp. A-GB7]|uniref:acyl-CoA dehydrogenase family protein n=1 Tax=Natronococcus sp. A-GB7 TaxID=3037649 RepID=UPI00241DC360|nr:acyl-CoA dehydrogenase family protein [Natronococcus sp. A-GB7]MDG5820352.1 acyl-CoA dehydrogenase family protein [Natronococcus sp. A-GB7]